MNDSQREELLSRWIRPSSNDEVTQQERALRMVTDAIDASRLGSVSRRVYAKGSYQNNTNVRVDSDVDIAVDCHALMYYESYPDVAPKVALPPYQGEWNEPASWRRAVVEALKAKFGAEVDTSGKVAIHIPKVPGSRPNIDVVPGFHYRKFTRPDATQWYDGSKVFPTTGTAIVNWPDQQLANGRAKNDRTGKRYKNFVRALKNAENEAVRLGNIEEKASFLMECLVFNVDDATLKAGSLSTGFRGTLLELWSGLENEQTRGKWLEPSKLKYLFQPGKAWTVEDAKEVVAAAWGVLEYA